MKFEAAIVLLACTPPACEPLCGVHEQAAATTEPDPLQIADLGARCYGVFVDSPNPPGYEPLLLDFDGDSVVDILSVKMGDLLLQRGRAAGGFELAMRVAALPDRAHIVVADVDADEAPDVLAVADDELTVYLHGPDGSLVAGPAQHFTVADDEEDEVPFTALDRQGDRPAALAVGNLGSVVLFELDATGAFGPHQIVLQRDRIVDLFRVELDATPGPELAIVADGALWIYEPDDGMVYRNLALTQDVRPVVVDIEGDGRDELAVLETDAIVVYRVEADTAEEVQRFAADEPNGLLGDVAFALGHLDTDGAIDAVSVSPRFLDELGGDSCGGGDSTLPGRVELLLANGTRAKADHDQWNDEPAHILVLDLDGDGWGDIVSGPSVMPARACDD